MLLQPLALMNPFGSLVPVLSVQTINTVVVLSDT